MRYAGRSRVVTGPCCAGSRKTFVLIVAACVSAQSADDKGAYLAEEPRRFPGSPRRVCAHILPGAWGEMRWNFSRERSDHLPSVTSRRMHGSTSFRVDASRNRSRSAERSGALRAALGSQTAVIVDDNEFVAKLEIRKRSTVNAGEYGSFVQPNVTTLVVNYKHDKWAVTPALQYSSGAFYGYPLDTPGVDPALGCAALAGVAPNTSRNPGTYSAGGLAYDAAHCNSTGLYIPNPNSGNFDTMARSKPVPLHDERAGHVRAQSPRHHGSHARKHQEVRRWERRKRGPMLSG